MGLSFQDETSMVEANIGSLRFAPDIISENGIVDGGGGERRHDNFEIQLSDDSGIRMVDR